MVLYILQEEYEAGKQKIVMVNYDADDFKSANTISASHFIKRIDELNPDNKNICRELAIYASRGKYYHSPLDNNIYEVENWQPREEVF